MKRKLLTILLGAIAVFACAFGFAGCDLFDTGDTADGKSGGNKECVHTIIYCPAKEATCKETGNTEFWYCNSCGKYFSDEDGKTQIAVRDTTLEKTGHREVTDPAIPATCTTAGKTAGRHCVVCNTVTLAQTVVPAGHKIVIIPAVPATCTRAGKTEGQSCSVCNKVIVSQHIVEPAKHKEVIDEGVEATCTEDGKTEGSHCSACDEILVAQERIPAGHTEVTDERVEATCTENGKTEGKHCSACDEVLVAQEVIPAGHKEVIDPAVEATCLASGLTEGKHCSRCKEVLIAQTVIPQTDHVRVTDSAVGATCSAEGKTEGEHCSVCNTIFTAQQVIEKLPHSGSGKLCTACGALMVAATEGLTFAEKTLTITRRAAYSGSVDITGPGSAGTVTIVGYEVTGGVDVRGELIIPESHNDKPVLGIRDSAFRSNTQIRSVTVPNGVRYIGIEAFAYCTTIREVHLADSVEEIGVSAFRGCTYLYVDFKCPKNLTKVTDKLFSGNTALKQVIICGNVTEVSLTAFTDCTALTDIYFEGTQERWDQVKRSWNNVNPTINFYSETEPTESGNFWHYVDGVATKWN
ncbi:MAG: leucine-rich repeat domain-containing protein [Clostridia bacterium]|nr:leucine-rich repeat domain-containing protein [Clostridia bacterium]